MTATAPAANSIGVTIGASNNTIGGTAAGVRNVISGHDFDGVVIFQSATGNLVQGNLIGTDASGTADLGNRIGVRVDGTGNTIGGTVAGARNVISGNDTSGVEIRTGNVVQGNFIGTDAAGTNPLGNAVHGVFVPAITFGNAIGGTSSDAGNVIAFNGADGVFVEAGTGNAILGNSIFSNAGLGIDLASDGPTPNDPDDGDTGPNNLQNFPDVASAEIDTNGNLVIVYSVDSAPGNSTYPLRVELFIADADGEEGETFVGSDAYLGSEAQATKTVNLGNAAALGVANGDLLVSTATDDEGNTSEFSSPAIPVVATCGGQVATIVGTNGADGLVGTAGHDVIAGLDGADTIFGLGGNDMMCGGPGDDKMSGGPGNDWLFGSGGDDLMLGTDGNDRLLGGDGGDTLVCGAGFDLAYGGPGTDVAAASCELQFAVP